MTLKKQTKSVTLLDTMKHLDVGDIVDFAEDLHLTAELEQPAQYFLDYVLDTIDASPKEQEKALTLLADYLNNMPHWQMRGYTPDDTMKTLDIKQLSQPAVRRMRQTEALPYDLPWLGGPLQPFVAPKKVGGNDPCPRGSGKKYKNCCGRGN